MTHTVRFLSLAALALVACSGGGDKAAKKAAAPTKPGPYVAYVGDDVITADEVQKKLAEQSPFLRARYKELTHRKEFVQNLLRFEVLSQQAVRDGLDKDPEVASTLKKVLVQEYIRRAFDEKQAKYSDEELKAYYDKHIDEFVKPERVRASHIFLAGATADKAARAKAKALAVKLLAEIKANEVKAPVQHPKHAEYSTTLFADLARKNSEDPASQGVGGDLRYLSQEDMSRQYGEELTKAIFALKEANELTGIVETPKGFHLARLTNRQASVNRAFDDQTVRDTIRGRLFREQKTKSFDEFVEKLKKDANVRIDEEVLKNVEVSDAEPGQNQMPKFNPPPTPPPMPAPAPSQK